MRRFSKVALSGALALAAVALLGAGGAPKVGDVAPPFELTLIDGSKVSSDALRGQVVVPSAANGLPVEEPSSTMAL